MISTQIRTFPVLIPANRTVPINISGSFLKVLRSTSETDMIYSFDHGTATEIPVGVGIPTVKYDPATGDMDPAIFNSIQVQNPTPTDVTVTLSVSMGEPSDSRSFIEGWVQIDSSAPMVDTPAAVAVGTDPQAPTILLGSNLLKERIVSNTGDFTIWWGDENVDPATKRGLPIYPGGTAVINCRGAIYLLAEDGASTLSMNNVMKG